MLTTSVVAMRAAGGAYARIARALSKAGEKNSDRVEVDVTELADDALYSVTKTLHEMGLGVMTSAERNGRAEYILTTSGITEWYAGFPR